jgi:hypothetical protein
MPVRYPIPWTTIFKIAFAVWRKKPREFQPDARACLSKLNPPLQVIGSRYIPSNGPVLLTMNHYSRPGFQAWWMALAISSIIPARVHWVVTSAWTYSDQLRANLVTPASHWLFQRVAQVYGFTSMPPMPPNPDEVEDRARAVRKVLSYVRSTDQPVVGFAPEGKDSPDGLLQFPPDGVGRFIDRLSQAGLIIVPVGVFETTQAFCLRFGPAYELDMPPDLNPQVRDRLASQTVMEHIAGLIPAYLRGKFAVQ